MLFDAHLTSFGARGLTSANDGRCGILLHSGLPFPMKLLNVADQPLVLLVLQPFLLSFLLLELLLFYHFIDTSKV